MIIKVKKNSDIPSSEITDEKFYLNRRQFLRDAGLLGVTAAAGVGLTPALARAATDVVSGPPRQDKPNTYEEITSYNNFYGFGPDKDDPAANAYTLKPKPWSIAIEGEVAKPAVYDLEDFVKPYTLEDRVYRHRCVEAWSLVIPWRGFPLADVVKKVQPTSKAKFVEFITLLDPVQMPYQRTALLPWPYREGLRLDEAMHPLALLVVGLYGKELPNQDGAPLRLHVPWKYGFKSIKSIVKIRFVENQPQNTWNMATPNEYGFYANVNPNVDHPRWSQAMERRLPSLFKSKTLMFNGYDEVAPLYAGMDLRKYY
jgi:methionine sulfoxide reductase catalytic subunit